MLSYPDFSEKQILFVQNEHERHIALKNDNLAIYEEDRLINQVSLSKIFCVFIIGDTTITTNILRRLIDAWVCVFLMRQNFSVYATIGAETEWNTLLRASQYAAKMAFIYAKQIMQNKIINQRSVLASIRWKTEKIQQAIAVCDSQITSIDSVQNSKELLGYEGNASKAYFSAYFEEYGWLARMPRAKIDILNLLLDMGYTYLFNFVDANLRLYGFDVYLGIYHTEFYMRKSLVCDIVEPFRCIIDTALVRAMGLKMIDTNDFEIVDEKYLLPWGHQKKYATLFLEAIMERKEDIFRYIQGYYRSSVREEEKIPFFSI